MSGRDWGPLATVLAAIIGACGICGGVVIQYMLTMNSAPPSLVVNRDDLAPSTNRFNPSTAVKAQTDELIENRATYDEYYTIRDDNNLIVMEVPEEWDDVQNSSPLWETDDGDPLGPSITAAPNVDDFYRLWTTPGVFLGASSDLAGVSAASVLDGYKRLYEDDCTYDSRNDYADTIYTGAYDIYTDCGGASVVLVVLSAAPEDESYQAVLMVQIQSDADFEAIDRIFKSFIIRVE